MAGWGAAARSCDGMLNRIEKNDPTLREWIILPSKIFGESELERLAIALFENRNTHLTTLGASGHAIPPSSLRKLGKSLINNTTLQSLAIGDKNMGNEGVISLLETEGSCRHLKTLDLEFKNMSRDGILQIGKSFSQNVQWQDLILSRNPIGSDGIIAFCNAAMLKTSSHLTSLHLSDCEIGKTGLERLCEFLPSTNCKILSLSSNPLGPSSGKFLKELIEKGSLETLLLSSCQLTCLGISELCKASACPGLQTLDLSKNDFGEKGGLAVAHVMASWTSLRDLNLANNEIGCVGMSAIAKYSKHLTSLDASHTLCGTSGAIALIQTSGLQKLRLFDNHLSTEGFYGIAANLQHLELLELDLGGNQAKADDMILLLKAIRHKSICNLQVLELGANEMNMDVEEEVLQTLKTFPSLNIARDRPRSTS
jgi:Ran GTPase-activating protein (RanGAP) involved in mRNA processing and transport